MRIKVNTYAAIHKINQALEAGLAELTEGGRDELQKAADKVADKWSDEIPAGRGGSWNDWMKDIQGRVTITGKSNFFVRLGWLDGGPPAKDGSGTWFIYHDTGYQMFGGPHFVSGLNNYLKMRSMLLDEMDAASDRIARRVEREISRR